jgi:uncharacterized protein (TIGR02271 family)
MDLKGKLKKGMRIFGIGDKDYGTIDRWDDDYVYVGQRRVPYTAFERMDKDRLYVGQSGTRYFSDTGMTGDRTAEEGEIRVPVVEERLNVDKQATELGAVNVRKTVETEQVNVPVDLTREEVHVEEVDVADRPIATADAGTAFKEATIRVPIRGEEAVASKEAVVTGEVVIDRERTTERETISDTLRREHVEVDKDFDEARPLLRQNWERQRSTMGSQVDTRTWDDVEPNYRHGFRSAHDQRWSGRDFDDVEPDLRRDWETTGSKTGDTWEHLREEIRQGWNHARTGTRTRRT